MKLDASAMRYLTSDDWRVLTAVEQGMKNHELVPTALIPKIARLKRGGWKAAIQVLHKNKLLWHDSKNYDGYKLTYAGYDFLALRALVARGSVDGVGRQIGVGKESDIFLASNTEGRYMALKLHRLGRTSFRAVKNNRDYLRHRKWASWLYMARLAALKEFAFMKVLKRCGFPVPEPIDCSRHAVLMSVVDGFLLANVSELKHPGRVYNELMQLIVKFAQHGLIHCDFNEFNIMIDDEENVTIIDFPQMVSTSHENAEMYFARDVQCIRTYFSKRYHFEGAEYPVFSRDAHSRVNLDVEVEASGFSKTDAEQFRKLEKELAGLTVVDADTDDNAADVDDNVYDDDNDDDVENNTNSNQPSTDRSTTKLLEPGHALLEDADIENDQEDITDVDDKAASTDDDEASQDEDTESDSNSDSDEDQESAATKKQRQQRPQDTHHIRQRVKRNLHKKQAKQVKLRQNKSKNKLQSETRQAVKHWK